MRLPDVGDLPSPIADPIPETHRASGEHPSLPLNVKLALPTAREKLALRELYEARIEQLEKPQKMKKQDYREFGAAREFLRREGLVEDGRHGDLWYRLYCKNGLLPKDIPSNPKTVYAEDGWTGFLDFLGYGGTEEMPDHHLRRGGHQQPQGTTKCWLTSRGPGGVAKKKFSEHRNDLSLPEYQTLRQKVRTAYLEELPKKEAAARRTVTNRSSGESPEQQAVLESAARPRVPYRPIRSAETEAEDRAALRKNIPGITCVLTKEDVPAVLAVLNANTSEPHAWDTESKDIDLRRIKNPQAAILHGSMLVATCYIGEKVDFGNGPRLFIDNRDGIISEFKEYFQDAGTKKAGLWVSSWEVEKEKFVAQHHRVLLNGDVPE